ncbi:MAG: hypothetical protein H0W73_03270 [Bacteroidetes bacterium]|nr:hypothetical protein [Bacteroidota bacterium]
MKYLIIFSLCFFLSCSNNPKIESPVHDDTPKVLQEPESESEVDVSSFKRIYKNYDILEEIFEELAEKNPDYKALLKQIDDTYLMKNDSLKEFTNYNEKSLNYYGAADTKINSIQDTVLRESILKLLLNSNKNYTANIAPTQKMIDNTISNDAKISDLLIILKITSTIKYIEKYQDKQSGTRPIKAFLKQQESVIKKINAENKKNGF